MPEAQTITKHEENIITQHSLYNIVVKQHKSSTFSFHE